MTIHIRRARLEEAEQLTELAMRSKASWGYDEAFMARCRDELTLTSEKMHAWTVWVAEVAGDVAGMIALAEGSTQAEVEDLMVDPKFQGRGVGAALMDALLAECRRRGIVAISLDADPNAEPFYHRFGFATVGRSESGSIPGRFLPRMQRGV